MEDFLNGYPGAMYNEVYLDPLSGIYYEYDQITGWREYDGRRPIDYTRDKEYADWALGNNWLKLDDQAANYVLGEGWNDDTFPYTENI